MRGRPALRAILAATVAVGACVLATGALAAPSATPQPTPPPGGGFSGGGGGTTIRRPPGPVAVANGKAGAELLEATGERTQEPVATAATPTTPEPPPATTTEPPATTAEAPVTTAEIAPPTTTEAEPAGVVAPGADGSGPPALPRDGIVVLVGVLLLGLVVALRAIRSRERRIGWALLAFCMVYLLALAGLVTGVAGAATTNPGGGGVAATAGAGGVLLTFDLPPAGLTTPTGRASPVRAWR